MISYNQSHHAHSFTNQEEIGQCSLKLNNQFCALIPKCRRFDVFSFDFWRQVLRDIVLDGLELSGLEGFRFLPVCFNSSSDKMSY